MYRRFWTILIITIVFACSNAYGQFPMLHYTIDDGLPSNTVYSVYRDSKGFLWIATDKGVAKYNGIRFEKFTTSDGIPDNEVFFFQEDNMGRIWLATYNGELCYYKDSRFHTAVNTPFLKLPFKSTLINKIAIEADSTVTIMFGNREKFINIDKDNIDIINVGTDTNIIRFFSMYKQKDNTYQFLYPDSIKVVDKAHRIISRKPRNFGIGAADPNIFGYSIAQNQKYIIIGNTVYTPDMKKVKVIDDKNKFGFRASQIYFDNKKFFMVTDGGLFIDDSIRILPDLKITSITQDVERNYWVSTFYDGLYVVDNNYVNFHLFNKAYDGNIRYAYADSSNLFYTTSDNNFYRLQNSTFQCLFNYVKYTNGQVEYGINHGFLVTKNAGSNNYSYFNYYKNYIIYIKDVLKEKKLFIKKEPFIAAESVKSIIDAKDNLYIRTINRVYAKKITDFETTGLMGEKNAMEAAATDRIFAFARSFNNDIWFSTVNGVYKTDNITTSRQPQFKDVTFKRFEFLGDYLVGYTANNRLIVCKDIDNKIEMDTVLNQNCIWDKFYPVDNTHMLISTNDVYRMFTINPPGSAQPYTVAGVENPILPLDAEWFCSNNKNCFFFVKGNIVEMGIDNLMQKTKPPTLFYDLITYGRKRYVMHEDLKVAYQRAQNISITFSTLSFTGKTISYRYSVSTNGEDNWLDLTGDNIDLIDPKYGNYTIKIKAKSVSSAYCTPIEFTLEIAPPFWATWWFITLCVCAGIGVVVAIARYRIMVAFRKTQRENDNKIRFMKSEYKALNALMNPHFIFNTLNNVQGLVNRNDKLAANEYLRIFADLIRQNMHNVSKELISLQKEIDLVANYLALEKLRFKEMLNYSINVDDEVDTTQIMIPPLFIQPLVENSIKHGIFPKQSENSRVELNVFEVGDVLHIEVRDNGVGLSHAKKKADSKHESFGLNNIKVRIEQLSIILGKKIDFIITETTDERGNWTIVLITMSL